MRTNNLKRHMKVHKDGNKKWKKRSDDEISPMSSLLTTNQPDDDDEISPMSSPLSTATNQLDDDDDDDDNCISNKYTWRVGGVVIRNHSHLLPRDVRAILIGKSGVGKTTLLVHLLLEPGILDYNNLLICGKSLHQSEYNVIKKGFDKKLSKSQIGHLFKHQEKVFENFEDLDTFLHQYKGKCNGGINVEFNDDVSTIPDPSSLDPSQKNLVIFDDVMLESQSTPEKYYTRGRHNGIDVFYIAQSYFPLPRTTERENGNIFFFFKQDNKNLAHIFQDHCAIDGISLDVFRKFCNDVWNENKHNFVTIDLTRDVNNGKYRKNLKQFWNPIKDA